MSGSLSPLRYPGGKGVLYSFLSNVILYNNFEGCDYYEPFAGGAGVALKLLNEGLVKRVFLNDADKSVYAFWISVLYDTEDFINLIKKTDISIDEWHIQKEIYQNEKDDLLKLGFAVFYLNRSNRSGIIAKAGPIGGYAQTGNWKIDARFNKDSLIRRILKISNFRDKIIYSNDDALSILQKILGKTNNFIYLDPPYYHKGRDLYLNIFNDKMHQELSKILRRAKHSNWVLTYDNCHNIKELYFDKKVMTFSLNYSLQEKKKGEELLIIPDNLFIPSQININGKIQNYKKIGDAWSAYEC